MFADIAGFTAWSSEREPSEVFNLLETLVAFDQVTKKPGGDDLRLLCRRVGTSRTSETPFYRHGEICVRVPCSNA